MQLHVRHFLARYPRLILALAITVVFWRVYSHDFVFWDDHSHIFQNPLLQPDQLASGESWGKIWGESYRGFYIPLTYSLWAVVSDFFGLTPKAFHGANVVFHFFNTVLVFSIVQTILFLSARKRSSAKKQGQQEVSNEVTLSALAVALLFAIHPIQIETVAWATGMKDLLSTFLGLLSVRAYLSKKHSIAAVVFFGLALLAKPSLTVLPLGLAVLDYFFLGEKWKASLKKLWIYLVLAIPFALVTARLQMIAQLEYVSPLWFRPFMAMDTFSFYLGKLFFPYPLTPVYGRTPQFLEQSRVYLYTVWPTLAIFAFAIFQRQKRPWILGGLLFFAVGIAPVSGLLPFLHQNYSTVTDHYFYFPFLGLILVFAFFLHDQLTQTSFRWAAAGATWVLLACLIRSSFQMGIWKDDDTLFSHAELQAPQSAIIQSNYGSTLYFRKRYSEALQHYQRAAALKPDSAYYNNIGSSWVQLGNNEEARNAYRKGLEIDPENQSIKDNLSKINNVPTPTSP